MPKGVIRAAIAVGVAALAGACAGVPRLYNQQISPSYNVPEYNFAAGRRDLLTVVRGDPFGTGEAGFEAAVIDVLNRHQPRPQPTHFTNDPGEGARPYYRTVLLFGAPPAILSNAICRASFEGGRNAVALGGPPRGLVDDEAAAEGAEADRRTGAAAAVEPAAYTQAGPAAAANPEASVERPVRVAAAFCRGGGALTSVVGEVGGAASVDDPAFDALVAQLVLNLFPLESEQDRDDCPALRPGC